MKEGTKQLQRIETAPGVPESYLLCHDCDGTWVDAHHGNCTHCEEHTTSRDFHLCLACALRERRCQHCGEEIQVRITTC